MSLMKGKKGLIMGVANDRSIAWAIAKILSNSGAKVALTYQGEVLKKRVEPLAKEINSSLVLECNVENENNISNVFKKINRNDLQRIAIKTGLAVGTIAGFLGLNHYLSGDDSIVSYAKEYGAEGLLSKTVQQAGKTTVQTGKGMLKIALAGPAALSYLLKSSSAIEQAKKAAIENAKQAAEAAKKEAEEALAKQAAEQTANTTKSLVSYFMS